MSRAVGLLKQGWNEIPHIMFCGGIALLSIAVGALEVRRHKKYHLERRMWKKRYTVVREEDFDPKTQVHRPTDKFPFF